MTYHLEHNIAYHGVCRNARIAAADDTRIDKQYLHLAVFNAAVVEHAGSAAAFSRVLVCRAAQKRRVGHELKHRAVVLNIELRAAKACNSRIKLNIDAKIIAHRKRSVAAAKAYGDISPLGKRSERQHKRRHYAREPSCYDSLSFHVMPLNSLCIWTGAGDGHTSTTYSYIVLYPQKAI